MFDTSANTAPKTSMIFKIQPLAAQLYRVLLITIVFSFLKLWDTAANATFSIDNVASLAKKLAAEPFKPPQPRSRCSEAT
jgi:glucan biosynthesis protein